MKKIFILLVVSLAFVTTAFQGIEKPPTAMPDMSFKDGEWFKFRIHYGIFNASYAELDIKKSRLKGKKVYHIKGKGESTGLLDLFFKVDDKYETYIDRNTVKPYRFIRKINEGGHKKNIQIDFDHEQGTAVVNNKKYKTVETLSIKPQTQDMVSAFYHLRNVVNVDSLQVGDEFTLPMFFDNENYDFKLKFLKHDVVKTKFGKVKALKFRPYVQSGRVFEEEESLTVWISADKNKIPLKIKANILVGSITADLDAFKGLKHSFKIIVD
ncbi:MAG: DUF3108 domain-containing protein [Nonlabens sp.]